MSLRLRLIRFGPAMLACVMLVCLYWRGLDTWFYQDDFGWLHLGPAKSFGDFLHSIFTHLRPCLGSILCRFVSLFSLP